MLKLLKIFLLLWLSTSVLPYSNLDNFRISIPEFIPQGKNFKSILTTSKVFKDADELDIYIITGSDVSLNGAELWTKKGKAVLLFSSVFLDKFGTSSLNISIDLVDGDISEIEKYFQVLLRFGPVRSQETNIMLYGEFKKGGNVIGYLENYDYKLKADDDNLYEFPVRTFKKYQVAENCAVFKPGSELKIPLKYKLDGKLAIDFWVKHFSFDHSYFKFFDETNNREEFSLYLSEYQMMTASSDYHEQISIKPKFISENAWYNINIVISDSEQYIDIYCNNEQISKIKLIYKIDLERSSIEFVNPTVSQSINLEQLRLFNLNASASKIFQSRSFINFSADSTQLLFQLNFEERELNSLVNSEKIFYSNIKLVNSDAPIFPRAPEINLRLMNNYYEIEWAGGDYSNVTDYVLERAVGDGNFVEIAIQSADRKSAKTYTHLTEKSEQSEIVYYRIKQVNVDKTEVFSEIVKVGQGIVEDVILKQNYPNPFNPKTQIEFELVQDSDVEVVVYNLAGKEVALLNRGFLSKGIYKFEFDGSELPSGIYMIQVVTSQSTQTRKMILAK